MSQNIYPLTTKTSQSNAKMTGSMALYSGRGYDFTVSDGCDTYVPSGTVGDYQVSLQHAGIEPVRVEDGSAHVYFYDTEARLQGFPWHLSNNNGPSNNVEKYQVQGNVFNLLATEMTGPEIIENGQQTLLSMQPVFHLHYDTVAYAAQLGVVHLVQSQRLITLENGAQHWMLDTQEPVLYLHEKSAIEPVIHIGSGQKKSQSQNHDYHFSLEQTIPEQLDGEAVESVTVLEQYQSYFMQRECSNQTTPVIWTPLLARVTWGWSIRVGRRADGEWAILRRKIIRPTVGNDGLELPQWQSNHLACTRDIRI